MTANRPLHTLVSWTLIGNLSFAVGQWVVVMMIARAYGPEALGLYALATAITAPTFLLANLQLRQVAARDATRMFPDNTYVQLRFLTSTVAYLAALAIGFSLLTGSIDRFVFSVIAAAKAAESMSDVAYGIFHRAEKMRAVALSQATRSAIALTLGAVAVALGQPLLVFVGCLVAANLSVWLLHDLMATKFRNRNAVARLKPTAATMRTLAITGLPLGVVASLSSLQLQLPRLVLEHAGQLVALGQYAALAYFVFAGSTLVAALGQSITPRLSVALALGRRHSARGYLATLARVAAAVGAIGVLVAFVVGDAVVVAVYGSDFGNLGSELTWVMIAGFSAYIAAVPAFGLTAAGLFRPQLPGAVLGTLAAGVASVCLVPPHGIRGAAEAMALSYAIQTIVGGLILARRIRGNGVTDT